MRVGFFPGDNAANRWGREIHPWSALATAALEAAGCEIHFLDKEALCSLPRAPDLDVVHLNWPQSLASPTSFKRRKYLPKSWFERWFTRHVDGLLQHLNRTEIPVVWQYHDLPYAQDDSDYRLLKYVYDGFYARAEGLLFYEESARPPVHEVHGEPNGKAVGIAHLGDYTGLHGPAIGRAAAREKLGITGRRKVFLYAGTVRFSRNPRAFVDSFIDVSGPDDLLIVTGRGTRRIAKELSHPRVDFRPGMTGHEEFRDLICASDFVVNDAQRYLGSAVIRVALGYGVPVVASSFGCTADLARGAFVPIQDDPEGLERALREALELSDDAYRELSARALERHRDRPWSAYGSSCVELYRRVIDARR